MRAKQKTMFIVMLLLIICLRSSNQQDTEWLSPQNAFEFLAGNEAYFEDVPSDILNSYFFFTFDEMLQERNPKTGRWLFSSSHDLQKRQMDLVDELSESMDGSD